MSDKTALTSPALAQISKRVFRHALWILPLVALANVALLVFALDGNALGAIVVRPDLLGWAAVLIFVPWLTNAVRLVLWSRFLRLRLNAAQILHVIAGTIVANAVTPSTTGGPVLKWALLVAEGVPSEKANTLISFQVAEDSGALIPLLTIALILTGAGTGLGLWPEFDAESVYYFGFAALLGIGLLWLMLLGKRGKLGETVNALMQNASAKFRQYRITLIADWREMLRAGKFIALATTLLAAIQWAARFSIAGLVIGASGGAMQPALHWLLQWMVQTLGSIVPTPGGAGGVEAAFLFFFAPFVVAADLVPVMTIWRLLFFYFPLTVAAVLMFSMSARRDAKHAS